MDIHVFMCLASLVNIYSSSVHLEMFKTRIVGALSNVV